MKALGFYAAANAWFLALVVPLVLFYFLKLKRPHVLVPSLFLWRQVISDRRVNTPFQRFKRNLLLLLQILLLGLLVVAATQPFWRGRAARVRRIPVLMDCSASMAALDAPGGTSRLEAAKARVAGLIDGLLPDQELCLITFGQTARKRADFSNNRRLLRQALEQVRVEDVPSNIEDALRMTQALAQGSAFDEVLLFSDGNFPARASFELPFKLSYQRLPAGGANVGISSLSAKRWAEGVWDVFVCLESSSEASGPVTVELAQDGEIVATEHASVARGSPERMVFRVRGEKASSLEVRLTPEGFDSLASDNVAFLDLPAARPLHVFVPTTMGAYRHALTALKAVAVHGEDEAGRADAAYDLAITDRKEDLGVEAGTCCYVGLVPQDLTELVSIGEGGSRVVDWSRSCPLLWHVELSDLVILDRPHSAEGVSDGDYERRGYEVLVHGDGGPLMLQKREGGRLSLCLLFHTSRSTLPYRVGFPVMVSNLVQLAMEQAGLAEGAGSRTGVLRDLLVQPDRLYEVQGPDGPAAAAKSDANGILSGVPALRVGRYSVRTGGRVEASVGASLLAPAETVLASAEEIQFDEGLSVSAAGVMQTDRPLWSAFAMLAFGFLMGEWWYYHRRPGGQRP